MTYQDFLIMDKPKNLKIVAMVLCYNCAELLSKQKKDTIQLF